jgi:sulfopyruvate decarboxylase alpha subunit
MIYHVGILGRQLFYLVRVYTGSMTSDPSAPSSDSAWPERLYRALKESQIRCASYVPDAGHAKLIELLHGDAEVRTAVLTTEEEGIALAAGAWLGGARSVLLMQSSGAGNCINMLSLMASCRIPFLTAVTMRGEWGEFNPWQVPMSRATAGVLESMGVHVVRVEQACDVYPTVCAAAELAFNSDQAVAVLLAQRMLGQKQWVEK